VTRPRDRAHPRRQLLDGVAPSQVPRAVAPDPATTPPSTFVVQTTGVLGVADPDQVRHGRAPDCRRRGWHPFAECGEREWIGARNRERESQPPRQIPTSPAEPYHPGTQELPRG
jgi:hypothetical protein